MKINTSLFRKTGKGCLVESIFYDIFFSEVVLLYHVNRPMQLSVIFHQYMNSIFFSDGKISAVSLNYGLNIDCGWSLRPPHCCGSNEHRPSMV